MFDVLADVAAQTQVAAPQAAEKAVSRGGGLIDMVPLIIMVILMFWIFSRSNRKQQQKRQQMIDSLVKGTPVLLNSGVYGKIVEVREQDFIVEIADKVTVRVNKNGISGVEPDPNTAAEQSGKNGDKK